jgi:menaquinone-dependent protoporphyrinogen IX oxidase
MRILVGYASGYGSTKSYAEAIGEELRLAGHETTVLPAKSARNVASYDLVVIGGSIRVGGWLAPARRLARKAVKAGKRHAVFFCCLSARTEEGRKRVVEEYFGEVEKKVPGISPLDVGVFPGVANYDQYRFPVRGIMTGMGKKQGVDTSRDQDYREPEAAREWARGLNAKIR